MLTIFESKKSEFRIGSSEGIVLLTRFRGLWFSLYKSAKYSPKRSAIPLDKESARAFAMFSNQEFLAIRWAISLNKTFVLFC